MSAVEPLDPDEHADHGPSEAPTEPVGAVDDDTLVAASPTAAPAGEDLFAPPATPGAFGTSRPLTASSLPPPPDQPGGPGGAPPAAGGTPSGTSPRRAAVLGAIAGGVVSAIVASLIAVNVRDDGKTIVSHPVIETTGVKGEAVDVQAILAKVQPSVVAIETSEQTFQGVFSGAGSGIVLSSDGLVLTNAHVVSGAQKMTVVTADGKSHDATLVGSSPTDDIAVVKINGVSGLTPADLGSSADLQVGESVIAIGNALDLGGEPTVTQGIVSAKDRDLTAEGEQLEGLIQTDAAINPGNSGGPLVNSNGQVVGMNTAIVQDAQNLGFSIAIDRAKPIIEQLKAGKGEITPDQAFLGVSTIDVSSLTGAQQRQFDVKVDKGALVTEVVPQSGADRGGIKVGDVIRKVDDKGISSAPDVRGAIIRHHPGDKVQITVNRGGVDRTLTITLGRRGAGT
jgi:S1-C subfamily serine protease